MYFRADSSLDIGSGHVMRCLTLAGELSKHGSKCTFICRAHKGNMLEAVAEHGHNVITLPIDTAGSVDVEDEPVHVKWLGTDWKSDAKKTIQAVENEEVDWLVVDHYAIDDRWEQALRPNCKKLMVIDDLADRRHDCDLLLDQNYVSRGCQRYQGLVPPSCTMLIGPQYALLREEFVRVRERIKQREGVVKRIFVFFGGSDPDNMTGIALGVLSASEFSHIYVDVVIGAVNPNQEAISDAVKQRPRTTLHVQVNTIAELMAKADLALCAGGSATWERLYLGLPSLVVTIADNQVSFTRDLDRDGFLRWLGSSQNMDVSVLHKGLLKALQESERNRSEAEKGKHLVDGIGVQHVITWIHIVDSYNKRNSQIVA